MRGRDKESERKRVRYRKVIREGEEREEQGKRKIAEGSREMKRKRGNKGKEQETKRERKCI